MAVKVKGGDDRGCANKSAVVAKLFFDQSSCEARAAARCCLPCSMVSIFSRGRCVKGKVDMSLAFDTGRARSFTLQAKDREAAGD